MDYENYDNDTNDSDDDYFDYIEWLKKTTAAHLQNIKSDPQKQRQVILDYWKRGLKANLGPSELIDFLGVDTPSIVDLADYTEKESDTIMEISDSLGAILYE